MNNGTVIITGAGAGLGSALAVVFAAAGYDLILQHRRRLNLDVQALAKLPGSDNEAIKVHTIAGDLRMFGVLDEITSYANVMGASILINNAGKYMNKPITETSDCDIREVVETNMIQPMILTRKVWPTLVKNSGMVININSLAGRTAGAGELVYCASKHGLAGFGKALQFDATRDGVRVLDVYLGAMNTEMTIGRPDQEKFMDPMDVAQQIEMLTAQNQYSIRVSDIIINRRNYK